jgi:mRNA-degrading endonuclease RelE of RelBE toxin-antitoxin system
VNRWTVELRPSAKKEFRQLDEGPKQAASELILDLEEDGPAHVPAIQLRNQPAVWRARFHHDRYRMIYQVAKAQRRIIVKRIRLRPVAYEGMKS